MDKYQLIRGVRILDQLTEDSTEDQLDTNIHAAWPSTKKRQNATGEVVINNIQYIPYVGMKMLHVKSTSQSNGHAYTQALQFVKVIFENTDTPNNVTATATDGAEFHCQPIDLTVHNCKVRCSCLDFYYRFAFQNSGDNSLVGRAPPLYQRKTTNRPPANPTRVPGLCKHLLRLVQELGGSGLVK